MLAIFFIGVSVSALNVKFGDTAIDQLNQLRSDKFCELLAYKTQPYIVFSRPVKSQETSTL